MIPVCFAIGCWTAFYRLPARLKKRAAKLYQQHTNLQKPREIELTDERYFARSENGEARLPWNEFHKWKGNEETIIVYSSDLVISMFPRRWFASDADYNDLKQVLRQQIGEPGKPRKKA